MACVYIRKNKNGNIVWRVVFRRKGLRTLCTCFEDETEARRFVKICEENWTIGDEDYRKWLMNYIEKKDERIKEKENFY